MATKLRSYDFSQKSNFPKDLAHRYPWDQWFDGNIWKLERGKDFQSPTLMFERMLRSKGSDLGVMVKVRHDESGGDVADEKTVVIMAWYGPDVKPNTPGAKYAAKNPDEAKAVAARLAKKPKKVPAKKPAAKKAPATKAPAKTPATKASTTPKTKAPAKAPAKKTPSKAPAQKKVSSKELGAKSETELKDKVAAQKAAPAKTPAKKPAAAKKPATKAPAPKPAAPKPAAPKPAAPKTSGLASLLP